MATQNNSQNINGAHHRGELHHVALSQIALEDGFNPRGEIVEDAELEAMAETMRERGCLQPILVCATATGGYRLVAGGRRYRAAAIAGLTEIPAKVLTPGEEGEDEELELLSDAMIENELRSDLDPLQRAQGYRRMMERGLSVRGVAERLGGKARRGSRERRIREHLAILALPEDIGGLVAAGTVPLLAVKALQEICEVHVELARNAIAAVLHPEEGYEPYTWSEIASEGLSIAVLVSEQLPAGLFQTQRRYPLAMFTLGEKAGKDLAAYEKACGHSLDDVFFNPALGEQARLLGAARELNRFSLLIVGQEVGNRLVEDYIAEQLKALRAEIRREREADRGQEGDGGASAAIGNGDGVRDEAETREQRAERLAEQARTEREGEKDKREQAVRFNETLGLLAFKHLGKIKVEERVLRILAAVDLGGELRAITARGARLALPGWFTQTTTSTGKTKTAYLEQQEACERADRFLAVANTASDIAGRALTLIALASLVNEDAIAMSRRSYYSLHFSGPWAGQAERDLNAIVRERIKEGQLPKLDEILIERIARDEESARVEGEIAQAQARLEALGDRLEQLDNDALDQALTDAELAWGAFSSKTRDLREERERRGSPPERDEKDRSASEEQVEEEEQLGTVV